MSSSYSEKPIPPDPPRDKGYTARPPREPRREFEDEEVDQPKLGSLAQKARGKQLNQAKWILIVIGVLTILFNGALFALARSMVDAQVQKQIAQLGGAGRVIIDQTVLQREIAEAVLRTRIVTGIGILLGAVFLTLGVIVHRFPVPATIAALVLYILDTLANLAFTVMLAKEAGKDGASAGLPAGWIIRVLIIIALAKAVQSAIAYEKEKRAEAFGSSA
jgi:hypothetical protein